MYAQLFPGKPKNGDTYEQRKKWFSVCLQKIGKAKGIEKSIAFPYKIGCGLAGGDWTDYLRMIKKFALDNPHIDVLIVSLEKNPENESSRDSNLSCC